MSLPEIYTAAQVLIVAGSETTATGLIGATYLLLSQPKTFIRLAHEIRTHFSSEDQITLQSISSPKTLPYLHAVIEESLRLCPPGPGTFPRRVPPEGRVVCGGFVAGGMTVGIHQTATHRSERNFVEAGEFRPERWLAVGVEGYDEKYEADIKACFQPFSFGPRNCIGKK